jgi:ABC-type glycerol-3-phosphate transport system substrate-binding protein
MAIAEIEIALWPRGPQADQEISALLDRYHRESRDIRVRASSLDPKDPWASVSRTMTYQSGVDMTEVGDSWVKSIVATNSVRPFSKDEFLAVGGPDAFVMPAWRSKESKEDGEVAYSIPYRADTRLIFYRRDLLAQAGVDEATAFSTPQAVLQTLESLKRIGVASPLIAPAATQRFLNLSFVASWVWSVGADFIDANSKRVTFDQPEALDGIADYFRATSSIAPQFRRLEPPESDAEFCKGNAAVALSGPWLYFTLQQEAEFAHVRENFGIASPLGTACRGGTHLVIWEHSQREEAAFDFIRFLTSARVQADLSGPNFIVPARLEAIQATRYASDPNYQKIVDTIHSGRSYGASHLWSIVEDRLSRLLVQVSAEYLENPDVDLDSFLSIRLKPLARRINITFEG